MVGLKGLAAQLFAKQSLAKGETLEKNGAEIAHYSFC